MCIKIVCPDHEHEFNTHMSLEAQSVGAKEFHVDYRPNDPKIDFFMESLERMIKNGGTFKPEIAVKTNGSMDGHRLRTKIKRIKFQLNVNEAIKKLAILHAETDKKVLEIAQQCMLAKKYEGPCGD